MRYQVELKFEADSDAKLWRTPRSVPRSDAEWVAAELRRLGVFAWAVPEKPEGKEQWPWLED